MDNRLFTSENDEVFFEGFSDYFEHDHDPIRFVSLISAVSNLLSHCGGGDPVEASQNLIRIHGNCSDNAKAKTEMFEYLMKYIRGKI